MLRFSRLIGIGYIVICLAVVGASVALGPFGYAPFALIAPRIRAPVVVTIWYSTEKQVWLEAATQHFLATNPTANGHPIQIELKGFGSREISERVASKNWGTDTPPTAISPASSLWVAMLESDWKKGNTTPIIEGTPQPLVLSPLVLLGWENRVKFLWPNGAPADVWPKLHDALANSAGWKAYGGQDAWGPIKFGHTSAKTSNSGVQTLILLAYGYGNKTSGLTVADVQDAGFQRWLSDVEASTTVFDDSSGAFMNDMLRFGPGKYDLVAVYENLAIESFSKAQPAYGPLRVYYPPATLISDHPFATLQGDWTTADERAAANVFRDFLLSRASQQLALQSGFRPVSADVSITSDTAENPFSKYRASGIQADFGQQVEPPSSEVINALVQK